MSHIILPMAISHLILRNYKVHLYLTKYFIFNSGNYHDIRVMNLSMIDISSRTGKYVVSSYYVVCFFSFFLWGGGGYSLYLD